MSAYGWIETAAYGWTATAVYGRTLTGTCRFGDSRTVVLSNHRRDDLGEDLVTLGGRGRAEAES
jgi:hypothetical protein